MRCICVNKSMDGAQEILIGSICYVHKSILIFLQRLFKRSTIATLFYVENFLQTNVLWSKIDDNLDLEKIHKGFWNNFCMIKSVR